MVIGFLGFQSFHNIFSMIKLFEAIEPMIDMGWYEFCLKRLSLLKFETPQPSKIGIPFIGQSTLLPVKTFFLDRFLISYPLSPILSLFCCWIRETSSVLGQNMVLIIYLTCLKNNPSWFHSCFHSLFMLLNANGAYIIYTDTFPVFSSILTPFLKGVFHRSDGWTVVTAGQHLGVPTVLAGWTIISALAMQAPYVGRIFKVLPTIQLHAYIYIYIYM